MAHYIPQWWAIASANVGEIRQWLSANENASRALKQRAINNYTPMQLLVSGRNVSSAERMVESLRIMIEFGGDMNHIPSNDSAAKSAPQPVVEFLLENGAKWCLNGDTTPVIDACSYINAPLILRKIIGAKEDDLSALHFEHGECPADYKHDLTVPRLTWLTHLPDTAVKTKLFALLQRRKVIYFQSNAPANSVDKVFSSEVVFGLPVTKEEDRQDRERRLIFASNPANDLLCREVHCSVKYSSMTATNGQQDFNLELSLPVHRDLCHFRASYYMNEYIDPQVSHVGYKEFSAQVEKLFEVPAEYSYAVILMLLLHVNDPTVATMSSTRWEVLRPLILQSITPPAWLHSLARAWAHYDPATESGKTFGRKLQVYAQD